MEKQIITFSANEQILKKTAGQEFFADDVVGYIEAHFDLGDNWTGYDSIRAVWFTAFAQISTVLDQDGVCLVPPEVCNKKEVVNVNLVGSIVENNELTDRLTTYPIEAFIFDGNARVDGTETAPVTPSQFEQYVAIVEALVGSVKDIDHATLNADYTLTIYYSDGTSDTVGPIRGEQGPTGPTGNGIASIAKTGTSGTNPIVDTYTIIYTNGQTTTFTVTNGVKGDTGNGIQSIYLTGTSGAVKTYTILMTDGSTFEFEVTDGEVTQAVLDQTVEDIETDIYESTIVQVKSDTDPYFFRRTNNGNGCGHTCHDEIVGASVGFNQLVDELIPQNSTYTAVTKSGNTYTSKAISSASYNYQLGIRPATPSYFFSGRKYLVTAEMKMPHSGTITIRATPFGGSIIFATATENVWTTASKVLSCTATESGAPYLMPSDITGYAVNDEMLYRNYQIIDLTQMFGSTIADYIYTLEQGTAGAGVAFFRKYFGDDYYPYSAPTIRSVEGLVSHTMKDENDNIIGEYPLDSTVTLRGLLKLEDGKLKADGDIYKADGSVTRKYGIVDLGDVTWSYNTGLGNIFIATTATLPAPLKSTFVGVCSKYTYGGVYSVLQDKQFGYVYNDALCVKDSAYTDATTFKSAMSGVYLVYELATPTTETATPYAKTQKVDPSGTEEYVSTGVVPVGHNTEYPMTLIDTMPKANGSYTMHLTVANGKRTISWS